MAWETWDWTHGLPYFYYLDTKLQAIVVKPINICNIYIETHDPLSDTKINKLTEQIPKPHLLLGDLNSHSMGVSKKKTIKKAKILKKVISSNNLCILNNKFNIYLNPFRGSYSGHWSNLIWSYMDYRWKVHNHIYQPLCSDRSIFKVKFNRFEFRVFLFLD